MKPKVGEKKRLGEKRLPSLRVGQYSLDSYSDQQRREKGEKN